MSFEWLLPRAFDLSAAVSMVTVSRAVWKMTTTTTAEATSGVRMSFPRRTTTPFSPRQPSSVPRPWRRGCEGVDMERKGGIPATARQVYNRHRSPPLLASHAFRPARHYTAGSYLYRWCIPTPSRRRVLPMLDHCNTRTRRLPVK